MNIELDEVVQDVSDDALELAAGGAGGFCSRLTTQIGGEPFLTANPYPLVHGYSTLESI